MGDVLKVVGQARQAKAAMGGGGDSYDPGVDLPSPSLSSAFDPIAQSIGNPSQAQGFSMAMPMASQQADNSPAPAAAPAPSTPQDNPYDNLNSNGSPEGLSDNQDITVQGDRFQPKHESLLGKIADTLLILRGRAPVFRMRTDQANMEEAMKGYDQDHDAAIRRVNMIDPDAAQKLRIQTQQMDANRLTQEANLAAFQDKGRQVLGSMAGAILDPKVKNKDATYSQMLPTLRAYANQYHLDGEQMFPDKYDSDRMSSIQNGSIGAYQQAALANQRDTNHRIAASQDRAETETERNHRVMEALAAGRLTVSQQNADNKPVKGSPKSIFDQDSGQAVGTLSPDGKLAALRGDDGQWYAFRLRTPGDINSRVRSPGDDEQLRAAKTPKGQ